MNFRLLKYFLLMMISTACVSTDIVEVEIPHDEFIVVQGTLEKDSIFTGVRFTKTLSLNSPYDINRAELKGVSAYLVINKAQTIPLLYSKEGIYKPLYDHKVKKGSSYELFAEYNGINIYGKTKVPDTVKVYSANLDENGFVNSTVKYDSGFVYGATWEVFQNSSLVKSSNFNEINPENMISSSSVAVRTKVVPEEYRTNPYIYSYIYAFDKDYREYFISQNQGAQNSLFSNLTIPNWNINSTAAKVIGLFIGLDKSRKVNVKN